MRWKVASLLLVVAAAAGAAAVTLRGARTHEVAGQRFVIPEEWLFDERIAWLPVAEDGAFTFTLDRIGDPSVIPPHRVSVQSAERVCRTDRMAQIMKIACGQQRTTVRVAPPFQKVFPHPDYAFAWDYYSFGPSSKSGQPERLQVAWCTPIEPNPARPKGTAICRSVWGLDGIVLSLGFEENELAQLPAMRARATQLLLSWKVL